MPYLAAGDRPRLTPVQWLICAIAAIGFAFDTYELLMLPLVLPPALAEFGFKPGTPEFAMWVGRLFYIPAFAGGIFGLLGGYLLLNASGRPLEFHCTAPVKPTRAQEILYGPTLQPFLYGEQIGQTLLMKSTLSPVLVCTDSEPVLAVRDHTHIPVALVLNPARCASPESRATSNERRAPSHAPRASRSAPSPPSTGRSRQRQRSQPVRVSTRSR